MAGTIRRLRELREKIGDTGVDKLFRAAKKEDLPGLSRQLVKDFLGRRSNLKAYKTWLSQ